MATRSTRSGARPKKTAAAVRPRRAAGKPTAKRPAPKHQDTKLAEGASKQAQLIALLQSPAGGTLEQMTSLTGWQPHSVRGVISGVLRKRLGLNVDSEVQASGARIYRILGAST